MTVLGLLDPEGGRIALLRKADSLLQVYAA